VRDVVRTDRGAEGEGSPSCWVILGPLGDIEVEGAHRAQDVSAVEARRRLTSPRLGHDPLLPRGGGLAGKFQRVDARVVRLEIGPEQLAEQVGEALQRGEVGGRLALGEVVDEHVTHRSARDAVAIDELRGAGPTATREDPERRGRVVAEHAVRPQQLVEQGAPGATLVVAARLAGELEELDAVSDGDVADQAAFRSEDARHARQCLLCGLEPDVGLPDRAGERRESLRIAGAGHLGGELATRPRRGEQEGKAGPDHVRADHHQKTRGQVARRPSDTRAGSAVRGVDEAPPVRRGLCPTGQPPLLPGLTRPGLQPGDDGQDAGATALELADAVLEREWRGEEAVHHRRAGGCRLRPRALNRAGREADEELGAARRCRRFRHGLGELGPGHLADPPKSASRLSWR